jgi:hypothetical protein
MLLSITQEQLIEGILGAIGWVIFWFYFRNKIKYSVPVEGFLAWTFVWWFRKFGQNLHKIYYKKPVIYNIL